MVSERGFKYSPMPGFFVVLEEFPILVSESEQPYLHTSTMRLFMCAVARHQKFKSPNQSFVVTSSAGRYTGSYRIPVFIFLMI